MTGGRIGLLVAAALAVAGLAAWLETRVPQQSAPAERRLALPGLADALDALTQVKISRGDGSVVTLQKQAPPAGWIVAERNDSVDASRLRNLLNGLASMRVVEEKTGDAARYPVLQVEDATGAAAKSTRIDVSGAGKAWTVLLGKDAEPQGSYVRVLPAPAALLVEPRLQTDTLPARWIDTLLLDVKAARIQQVEVTLHGAPAYALSRSKPESAAGSPAGVADLGFMKLPPGRKPVSPAMLTGAASALEDLHIDDVHDPLAQLPKDAAHALFVTFDGLAVRFDGWTDTGRTFVRVHAESKSPETAAEAGRIDARAARHDFELPSYKYNAIFRSIDSLLEPVARAGGKR